MKKSNLESWFKLPRDIRDSVIHSLNEGIADRTEYLAAHQNMRAEVRAEFEEEIAAFEVALDVLRPDVV
jgi:hypothetical protein